jgi:hypothetical protein
MQSITLCYRQPAASFDNLRIIRLVEGMLSRKVIARRREPGNRDRHLARGALVNVLGQRQKDSGVAVKLVNDPSSNIYLIPADAIDVTTARKMSIHRPSRHRRSSGGSRVPVD